MSDSRLSTAILGAGGYIGQHFARLLANHPYFSPPILVGRTDSDERTLRERWVLAEEPPAELVDTRIRRRSPSELSRLGIDLAFSALPSGTAGPFESELIRRRIHVFSNAADHRLDRNVPLLIPEVNADHLHRLAGRRQGGLLVANPNCTATGLALALAPLAKILRPRQVHVSTYQALSGAGYPGIASLAIADNVVPFIPEEEQKVAVETQRILGGIAGGSVRPARIPIVANCARVAVRDGHLEAVTVVAGRSATTADILEAWTDFDPLAKLELPTAPHPPVELRPEPDRPQPLKDRWAGGPGRAGGMAAVVGRVRWDPPFLRFFLLSHNAVRGAAGGSVLNAELAMQSGYLDKPEGRFHR